MASIVASTPARPPQGSPPAPAAAAIVASGTQYKDTGHTEWPDGRVHHTGFTATMAPNTNVPYTSGGQLLDADYNSWQEGLNGSAGVATYAIVTSRSYHPGIVESALIDGSVRAIDSAIDLGVWRALAQWHSLWRFG